MPFLIRLVTVYFCQFVYHVIFFHYKTMISYFIDLSFYWLSILIISYIFIDPLSSTYSISRILVIVFAFILKLNCLIITKFYISIWLLLNCRFKILKLIICFLLTKVPIIIFSLFNFHVLYLFCPITFEIVIIVTSIYFFYLMNFYCIIFKV